MKQITSASIFATTIIPTTDIYQNHIDKIHNILDQFCRINPAYEWAVILERKNLTTITAIETYLIKREPKSITYSIYSKDKTQELLVEIHNGLSINIKNGSYALYGLYSHIIESSSLVTMPLFVVYLRRYWIFNLFASAVFIPAIILTLSGHNILAITWMIMLSLTGIVGLLYYFYIHTPQYVDKEYDWSMKKARWRRFILSTRIRYGEYNTKLGSPTYSLITSTETLVSLAASLATIISFIIFTLQR